MCDFLFQLTSSFVIGFLLRHAPVYGFSIDIKLLTLKLIERCKVICKVICHEQVINMKGCSSNNINRNLIHLPKNVNSRHISRVALCNSGLTSNEEMHA